MMQRKWSTYSHFVTCKLKFNYNWSVFPDFVSSHTDYQMCLFNITIPHIFDYNGKTFIRAIKNILCCDVGQLFKFCRHYTFCKPWRSISESAL